MQVPVLFIAFFDILAASTVNADQDEQLKSVWKGNVERGGLEGPMQWYVAITSGVQGESDSAIPEENAKVNVPMLFIGCDEDVVCRREMIYGPRDAGL